MRQWRPSLPALWSLLLALLLLGPALGAGYVLTYDMVWVPDLALRPDFLGVASGLPRAVPSDAVVAVLDVVLPGILLQKALLLGCLVGGGLGAARLVRRTDSSTSAVAQLVAVSLYQWNPFVAERLLIGHWPVLVGYAVLPWLALAARRWRIDGIFPPGLLLLVPLGSLSASAGLATAVVLLAFVAGRVSPRRTLAAVLLVVAANAPWVVSGLLHAAAATTDPAGARAFALAGEGGIPAPLAALGLSGIWNAEVVLPSRTGPLAAVFLLLVVVLAVAGARPLRRHLGSRDTGALVLCWVVGYGLALLTWAAPGAVSWLAGHVPGGGLIRDGARALALCAPLLVALVAHGSAAVVDGVRRRLPGAGVPRVVLAAVLVVLPVTLLPDAALGLSGRIEAVAFPDDYAAAREAVQDADSHHGAGTPGAVLSLPLSSYRQPAWNDDHKVLDPVGRYLVPDYLASDVLVVSGVAIAGEDPQVREVADALAEATPQDRARALAALGVGFVVVDRTAPGEAPEVSGEVLLDGDDLRVIDVGSVAKARVTDAPTGWLVAMTVAWLLFGGLVLTGAARGVWRTTRALLLFGRT